MKTLHRVFFSFFLACSLLFLSLATATPAGATVELITNGDFSSGLTGWRLAPGIDPSWDPLAAGNGGANLHPPTQGYVGPVLIQDVNISGISNTQGTLSFDIWQDFNQTDGQTIQLGAAYIGTDGKEYTGILGSDSTPQPELKNNILSTDGNNPTHVSMTIDVPTEVARIIRFFIYKNYNGSFNIDNLSFVFPSATIDTVPTVSSLSQSTATYGDTITISGSNFGNIQTANSEVLLNGTSNGIQISSWSDATIQFTVNAPAASGSVQVMADSVRSNTIPLTISSPHFAIKSIATFGKVLQGESVDVPFGLLFRNGYTPPSQGISFSLAYADGSTAPTHSFAPATLYSAGGTILHLDTTTLPPSDDGFYAFAVTASDGANTATFIAYLKTTQVTDLNWYDQAAPDTPITSYTVTSQGRINGWDNSGNPVGPFFKAVDNEGNPLPWDADSLLVSSNPDVVMVHNTAYGTELYARRAGAANLTVTFADNSSSTLPVTVTLPDSPQISLDIVPATVTNKRTASINFGITSTHFINSWGHDGFLDFSFNSQGVPAPWDPATSNSQSMPEFSNSSYTPLEGDNSGDNYLFLDTPPETGEYLFYADTSDGNTNASAAALLTITNDSTYSAISGWVASLEPEDPDQPPLAEMFTLDFFDSSGSFQFTRQNYGHPSPDGTYHFDAIEPGDYLVRCTFEPYYLGANRTVYQWYPNGADMADAETVTFTPGATATDINFFFSYPQVSARQLISEGRAALFNTNSTTDLGRLTYSGLLTAKQKFGWALEQDPTNQEANFFFAFTSILANVVEPGPTTGSLETIMDMLSAFGASRYDSTWQIVNNYIDSGSPFTFPTDPTTGDLNLPADSPTSADISNFLSTGLIPLIDNALTALAGISDPFDLTLLTTETGDLADTEIDYGDVLALRSLLQFTKFLVLVNTAYDLDTVDIDAMLTEMTNGTFDFNAFLDAYPNLLNLAGDGSTTMAQAKTTLINAIDSFLAASAYIRSETDTQDNDMVTIDPEMAREEQWFRDNLIELKDTLTDGNSNYGNPLVLDLTSERWQFFNQAGDGVEMWLEFDGNGNIIEGEYYGMGSNTFLSDIGTVDSIQINGSDITVQTSCDGQCPCSATLTGTLGQDGRNIFNGTYTADSDCTQPWSGTFSANRLEEQDETIRVNFSTLLDNPISIRDHLPQFVHDPYNGEMMMKGLSSLPDQTFGGILPDGILERDIDKVIVWGGTDSNGQFTRFSIWTYDIPLWEITSAQIYGPSPMQPITIDLSDPDSFGYNYRFGARLQTGADGSLPDGWYHVVLTDRQGRQYSADKHFTRNSISPVDMATATPADQSYLGATTPTLTWNGVSIADSTNVPQIYYRVEIRDWDQNTTIYLSDRGTALSHPVPADILQADTPYKWRVQAFDSDKGISSNNFSTSDWNSFYTGDSDPAIDQVSINWAYIRSRVRTDTPDPSDQTQYGINLAGPAPWDIDFNDLTVKNSNGDLEVDFSNPTDTQSVNIRENGYFTGTGSIKADGAYTFTIIDNRGTTPSQITTDPPIEFIYNRLPVPGRLFSVPWEGTVSTTTPTFAWAPVTDETTDPLYYGIRILDATDNTVFQSSLSTNTTYTMPTGHLLPNSSYSWQVEVYDAATDARNRADSTPRPFFVAPDAAPSTTGSVTGTVTTGASGYTTGGVIYVAAFDSPYEGTGHIPVSFVTLSDTGSFTLTNLPVGKPLYIYCRWDKDNSLTQTPADWVGMYAGNPLTLADTAPLSGIDMGLETEVFSEQQIINFDDIEAGWGPVDAASYLAQFGITLINHYDQETQVRIHRDSGPGDGNGLIPSSMPNSLSQDGRNDPVAFTLSFDTPLDSFTFTRPMLNAETSSGITHPVWSGQALDINGNEIDRVGENMIASYSDVPARTFTLSGPGIYSIRFDSDNGHWAAFSSVQLDDFILTRSAAIKGDANSDGNVDLADIIYIFKILTGHAPGPVDPGADVNGDGNIGLAEIVFILKSLAN
jgi:hypothetical protein